MATRTVWLRAAYAARARLPRCRMGWHAVSETVAVEVPVVDPDDTCLAMRVSRAFGYPANSDFEAVADRLGLAEAPRGVDARQRFDLLTGPEGLLAPVLGPDGRPVGDADGLTAMSELMSSMWDAGRRVIWEWHPGTVRTWALDPTNGRWPDAVEGSPMRPAWACPDVGSMAFVELDDVERLRALDAFRFRVANLRSVGGRLWTRCGTPVIGTGFDGVRSPTTLLIPGMDPDPFGEVRRDGKAVYVDHRSTLPFGLERVGTFEVEVVADHPRADVTERNLTTLSHHVRQSLRSTGFLEVPGRALPLLGWIDGLPGMVAEGRDLAVLEAETCARIRGTVDVLGGADARATGTVDATLGRLALWPDVVTAERAALEAATDAPDPDVATLSLG